MKNYQLVVACICVNLAIALTSCNYIIKSNNHKKIQREASEILNTPDLTGELRIEDLQAVVEQELKELEQKHKRKKHAVLTRVKI